MTAMVETAMVDRCSPTEMIFKHHISAWRVSTSGKKLKRFAKLSPGWLDKTNVISEGKS
jgi:hypothetical protein